MTIMPDSTELWIALSTSHAQALYIHPEEWPARVLGVLDHALVLNASTP
jgi:hypothetical protein